MLAAQLVNLLRHLSVKALSAVEVVTAVGGSIGKDDYRINVAI